jgi:hypothetical protein
MRINKSKVAFPKIEVLGKPLQSKSTGVRLIDFLHRYAKIRPMDSGEIRIYE